MATKRIIHLSSVRDTLEVTRSFIPMDGSEGTRRATLADLLVASGMFKQDTSQLYDNDNPTIFNCYVNSNTNKLIWNGTDITHSVVVPVKPSTKYTISMAVDKWVRGNLGTTPYQPTTSTTDITASVYNFNANKVQQDGRYYYTFTTAADANYLICHYYTASGAAGKSEADVRSTLVLTEGSAKLPLIPYTGDSFEVKAEALPLDISSLVEKFDASGKLKEVFAPDIVASTAEVATLLKSLFNTGPDPKQLYNDGDPTILNGYINSTTNKFIFVDYTKSLVVKVKPSTTYTISVDSDKAIRFSIATTPQEPSSATSSITASDYNFNAGRITAYNRYYYTFTTTADAEWMLVYYWNQDVSGMPAEKVIRASVMLSAGNVVTPYQEYNDTPYLRYENAPKELGEVVTEAARLNAEVLDIDSRVNVLEEKEVHREPLVVNSMSTDMKINDAGTGIDANAPGWLLRRYAVSAGDKVSVSTHHKFFFAASASISTKIGPTYNEGGVYIVPEGAAWLVDSDLAEFSPAMYKLEPRGNKYGVFGVFMPYLNNFCARLEDAAGMGFGVLNGQASSDFDNVFPWCDMKECNIEINSAGFKTITYKGQTGFSTSKDVFVEVPKFYFRREVSSLGEKWYISGKKDAGFVTEPWFVNTDGTEENVRYIAKYNVGTSGSISKTGELPMCLKTEEQLRTACTSAGFKVASVQSYLAIQHLFVVETATKNSQEYFGGVSGYEYFTNSNCNVISASGSTNSVTIASTERNNWIDTGDTIGILLDSSSPDSSSIARKAVAVSKSASGVTITFDGDPLNVVSGVTRVYGTWQPSGRCDSIQGTGAVPGSSMTRPFVYRGIENIYGNIGELADGMNYDAAHERLKINGKYVNYPTPYNNSYFESGVGAITRLGFSAETPAYTFATEVGGSGPAGYTDISKFFDEWSSMCPNTSQDASVVFSCAFDHKVANGIFTFRALGSTQNWLYGVRAML